MLRLITYLHSPGEARIVTYGDQPDEKIPKVQVENPDVFGLGETFQEARAMFKESLRDYINELQIFYENLESEDPVLVDYDNNIVEDGKGLIWFTDKPMVEDVAASKEVTSRSREVKPNE